MGKDEILKDKLAGLYGRRNDGIKFGLEVQKSLMQRLGDPQNTYAVVHVAGTNGKGSVCAMIAQVLKAAGLRAGLYISPHLKEFNERMSVNGECVSDCELLELAELVDEQLAYVEKECGRQPTFFEYSTALAMKYFEMRNVQVAVLETGMGGRLDATNVVTPLVSVITRIGIEHAEFLGDDIESIAGEKAGIIKQGRPVVCGAMTGDARRVIVDRAASLGCMIRDVEATVSIGDIDMSLEGQRMRLSTEEEDYGRVTLPLIGMHQVENCATAVAALEEIQRALGLAAGVDVITQALGNVRWPARCQVLSKDPPVILDGAHNPMASAVLGQTLRKILGGRPLSIILGMCGDKDAVSFLSGFHGVSKVWAVTIRNERAVSADELASLARTRGFDSVAVDLREALAEARAWAEDSGGAVCVAGSLFLAGEVLELMDSDE